jgi:hypothetical protein
VYAVLPRTVLVVKIPPFLICVHTKKIGGTLMKGSIYAGGSAVIPHETSFPAYRLRNPADVLLTLFFLFRLTFKRVFARSSMKNLYT